MQIAQILIFFFDNMISFPFHHWMSDDDFSYMIKSTKEVAVELGL